MALALSLIVCTRDRAEALRNCLSYISRAEGQFELIVVDNGSGDHTREVVDSFAESSGLSVQYVFEPVKGLARARNAGCLQARGDILAFTDDDCYIDPLFPQAVREEFSANPELGFLGGRIMLFDPSDLPITIKESLVEEPIQPGSFVKAGVVHGANLAIRRVAFEQTRGFDVLLGAGTPYPSEDIEMVARVSSLGWAGMYSPRPVVHHHHGRKTADDRETLERGYDRGRGAYYAACALNKAPGRWVLRLWAQSMRHQTLSKSLREVRGAGLFFCSNVRFTLMQG